MPPRPCSCDLGGRRHRRACAYISDVRAAEDALRATRRELDRLEALVERLGRERDVARLAGLAQRLRAVE